jgi:heme O synthase-like polyprenyltransferase
MKHFGYELAVSLGLLALLFVLYNPWDLLMPGYLVMSFLVGMVVLYVAFATFLWRENGGDERENLHRMFADRIAYLAGSAILLFGIIIGELNHSLNPWLIGALAAMVIAKVIGFVYGEIKL